MKLSPEERAKLVNMLRMQSVQTYGRNVVYCMMRHIEALEWEAEGLVKAGERLQENIVQLQRDLREAREIRKVPVPRDVAEAIEYYKKFDSLNTYGIFNCIITEKSKIAEKARVALAGFEEPFPHLMNALVNGYTVEQKTEDEIREKLATALAEAHVQSPIPLEQLVQKLALAIRETLAESRAEQESNH